MDVATFKIETEGYDELELEMMGAIFNMATMKRIGKFVLTETKDALRRHINEDVYDAHKPTVYPRRSEHEGYGPPLNDIESNSYPIGNIDKDGNVTVGLNYLPSGEHSGTFGDFYGKKKLKELNRKASDPIKPEAGRADGNALIRRIETGKGYDWEFDKERPFWTRFVEEMVDSGGFENALNGALAFEGIEVERSEPVVRTPEDGVY